MKKQYQATYDVLVIGFGGAGATAARFAADNGAKVLLVDSAPEGHEGGNTRYCGQLIGTSDNYEETLKYYHELTSPMNLPEDMAETYVHGMANMRSYIEKYLGIKPISVKKDKLDVNKISFPLKESLSEFPEYTVSDSMDFSLVHQGIFDGALWKILRQKVLDRKDKIDVWLESPAKHLIQDPESKTILGAQIERSGKLVNVLAKKGVILTTGGYENNSEMVQNYLGSYRLVPLGSLYNQGAGVRMASEVGAKLWHMWNYEAGGSIQHGLIFSTPEGQRARTVFAAKQFMNGSILTVTDDGTRYFNENEHNRHGHTNNHGTWRIPYARKNTHMIFDQKQYDYIKSLPEPYEGWNNSLIEAKSVEELAEKINVPVENLKNTIKTFNKFAEEGNDAEFHRDAKSMRAFEGNILYAVKMDYTVLNTQGGPQRNAKAQIVNFENKPIPHLYGAGELGGVCANDYQTACNIAECLIFGKIAGENVVNETEIEYESTNELNGINDILDNTDQEVELSPDQYLGTSSEGMGDKITVKVTYKDKAIKAVEIVQQNESEDVAKQALEIIPQEIVKANSTEVDAVSGASATSRAIKDAVNNAIAQATNSADTTSGASLK
ncbi:succinate dehydrogenase/fumarate reductase flavoprotein subunit [Lactobacillus colini]|uniref:Urocanate reductase n=1 Tax=Lactobacillus colini TaxID=1819254 RepID=A0ABS4MF35_9LACO|nr:FAD-binding protein [Lactobacillus colini]MBP2058297.1 succinate dehydrogenase/fumarate reductase flavoprotein subunit [Lactobacillus colini]